MGTWIRFLEPYERGLKKKGCIVTVSGLSGAGKSDFVRHLVEKTGFRRVYPSNFRQIAEERGTTVEEVSRTAAPDIDKQVEIHCLREAMKGNVIVDSRMSAWALGDWTDHRILVTCPQELRAKRVALRDGTTQRQALENLKSRDSDDARRYRKLYGIDLNDTSVYDIIVENTGTKKELERKADEIARLILRKSRER